MYQINQCFTLTEFGWLAGSCFITNMETGNRSVRSYGGAFFENGARRQTINWQQETFPTYDDIMTHAPEGAVHKDVYDELITRQAAQWEAAWNQRRLAEEQARQRRRKRFPWIFWTVVGVAGSIGMVIPWLSKLFP